MTEAWITDNYTFSQKDSLFIKEDYASIAYSDGHEMERKLYRYVRSASDRSVASTELLAKCEDWPTTYHLSAGRSNLFRPFEGFFNGKKVLELGCGCGAITRFLGESGADVVAVEGSAMRASIAAKRCEDLDNVTVMCEKILDLPCPEGQFDVVTLIGVLEYARMFSDSADPIHETLARAYSMLRPGGCLVLAIENRFGLKYFAGGNEDHLGHPMAGIQGEYTANSPVTFSRKELAQRLEAASFTDLDLHLPFPDYKLPTLMVHGPALDAPDFALDALLEESVIYDVHSSQYVNFSMQSAWEGVHTAGLTADLANSFLYFGWKETSCPVVPQEDLARYYGLRSIKEYMKEIVFRREGDGIVVRRRRLVPDTTEPKGDFTRVLEDEPYIPARTMQSRIVKAVNRLNWTAADFANAVRPWFEHIKSLARADEQGNLVVSGQWYDLIPNNAILLDGKVSPIDQEWRLDKETYLPLDFLVFRGLYFSITRLSQCAVPSSSVPQKSVDVCGAVMLALGIEYDPQSIAKWWDVERLFQSQVFPGSKGIPFERVAAGELPVRYEYSQLMQHITALTRQHEAVCAKLDAVEKEKQVAKQNAQRLEMVVDKLYQKVGAK